MEKPWLAHYETCVPHSLDYPKISLQQTLFDSARRFGSRPALHLILRYVGPFSIGVRMTYRELANQVNRFAAALAALGVKQGDRVGLLLPNLPQFVIAFYGSLTAGAIVVNANPQYKARELEQQFGDAGVETVILLSPFLARMREAQPKTVVKRVIVTDLPDYVPAPLNGWVRRALRREGLLVDVPASEDVYHFRRLLDAHREEPPKVEVSPDDVALLQYTGGTTGIPKAAMLTHHNAVTNAIQMRRWITTLEEGRERVMGAIPYFHAYGMTVSMSMGIYSAAELVLLANPRPVDRVLQAIHREGVTIYPGIPSMYAGIINHPSVSKYNLKSVKVCISGAAPLPMDVQLKFGEITGGRLVEGYGLTEAAPVTHCNPINGERRAGSIGLPLPDVDAKIMDYEKLVEQPVGLDGELWLRGPQVMKGYWRHPDETANVITEDGWLRTGDIARVDADGYFYIVDRLKDIIISSGLNIVPHEVEEVLLEHPHVQEAVVAGIPDPQRGETVKAFVVLKAGTEATADELIAFCRERLAAFKVPRYVEFRAELPKTTVGKLLRRVLVEEEKRRIGL